MNKKWFVTGGVVGGQFAVKVERVYKAMELFNAAMSKDVFPVSKHAPIDDVGISVRPAPPDLVEWLDTAMGIFYETSITNRLSESALLKVPGGWMHYENNVPDTKEFDRVFIPVALASGITVIPDD